MIPIYKPYMAQGITPGVQEVLYSGQLSFGKNGRDFENSLASYINNELTMVVSSHNLAVLIVLSTLGLKPGDQIIASPVSCLASNQPFAIKGLEIVWADVDPHTGSMLVEDVKAKITPKTKAIFHNHYCGYIGHVHDINMLGSEYGIPIVDDCIEAFGAEVDGKRMGSTGSDISVFSFQAVRLPNTIDGGAITFKNKDLYKKALLIRDQGIDRRNFRDTLNEISPTYDVAIEGYSGLMSEMNSVIGLEQMSDLAGLIDIQRRNALLWNDKIEQSDNLMSLPVTSGTLPNYWVYGLMSENKIETIKLFRAKGFYATGVHINNNLYSVFKNQKSLNGVDEFVNKFVAIPTGWWVKDAEIKNFKF